MKSAWLVVVAAASGRASADPACSATVGKDQQVFVAGKPTGIIASTEPEKYQGSVDTYALDASHILFAWEAPGHYGRPTGSELYVVDCKAPTKPKTFADGDFGHAVLLPDGKTIAFSNGDGRGIGLLDIATKKAKGLTYPPTFKEDSMECDGRERGLHDVIVALDLDSDLLEFERGGSCGFEGDWDSSRYFIDHITTKPSKPRRGNPIAVIASGAGDDVWAARAACDAGAVAVAWNSKDLGATWTKHAVPKAASGVIAIIVDAKQPGHVVVETGACKSGPMGGTAPVPDRIHVTKDGGATWQVQKLPLPPSDTSFMSVNAIASVDGSIEHLAVWAPDADGKDAMWTTSDAGANWKQATKVKASPSRPDFVTAGGANLAASTDGIIVRRAKGPTVRVYPYR